MRCQIIDTNITQSQIIDTNITRSQKIDTNISANQRHIRNYISILTFCCQMAKYVDNNRSLAQNVCKSKARMILQTGVNLTSTINSYRNVSRSNFNDGKICMIVDIRVYSFVFFRETRNWPKQVIISPCFDHFANLKKYKNEKKYFQVVTQNGKI